MPSDGGAWFELWNDEVNDSLRLGHSSGNGITVKNSGYVGIGSTNPSAQLEVYNPVVGGLGPRS